MASEVKEHRVKNASLTRELAEEQDMNAEAKTRRRSTVQSPEKWRDGQRGEMSLEDELQLSALGRAAASPDRSLGSELDRQTAQNRSTENLAKMVELEDLIEQLQDELGLAAATNADKTQQLQQMGANQVDAIKQLKQMGADQVDAIKKLQRVKAEHAVEVERWQQSAERNYRLYQDEVERRERTAQAAPTAGGADDARIEQNMVTIGCGRRLSSLGTPTTASC